MKASILLAILIGFAITPSFTAELPVKYESKLVSVDFRIPNGPDGLGRLAISDQAGGIFVQVPVPKAADVPKLALQVWLLKADGSVVLQAGADNTAGMIAMGGGESWFTIVRFPRTALADIVGITFRKQGKLYSQELSVDMWKPWN